MKNFAPLPTPTRTNYILTLSLTLKQTNNEKGRVIITIPHEIIVRSHPQRPMPESDSSAGKKWRGERELERKLFRRHLYL